MAQLRRTALGILALAAGIAVLVGEATRATWAQAITQIDARVIAVNIPGASSIAQVGTFIPGPPTPFGSCTLPHPIPTNFPSFIVTGAVLDPNRILVGSQSNCGAVLVPTVAQAGSSLSF